MTMNALTISIRAMFVALVLASAGQFAEAGFRFGRIQTASAAPAAHAPEKPKSDGEDIPLGGVLLIAGIVGGVVVLAWICSRVGDNRRDLML